MYGEVKFNPSTTLGEVIGHIRDFHRMIPESTVEGSLKHLGEEVIEFAMALEGSERGCEGFAEEACDVIITAILALMDAEKLPGQCLFDIPGALGRKMETNLNSEWRLVSPGKYRRVRPE